MMFPAGMAFSGAPAAWPLGGMDGGPPAAGAVDAGGGGTTPFHIASVPMVGVGTVKSGGMGAFVAPGLPMAGPEFSGGSLRL